MLAKPIIKRVFNPATEDFAIHVTVNAAQVGHTWTAFETTFEAFNRTLNIHEDAYNDFILVAVQPSPDPSNDIVTFIFRDLPGNERQIKSIGVPDLIPAKFKEQVTTTVTNTDVERDTEPDTPTGDLVSSRVEQAEGAAIALKTNTEEVIDLDADPLVSPSVEDQQYVLVESLVLEGAAPDCGTGVLESTVSAIGGGKAIKQTKIALTAYTNKSTYTAGFQKLMEETLGSIQLIPAKFRAADTVKTWRFRVSKDTLVAGTDYPNLGTGSGDYSGYEVVETARKQLRKTTNCGMWEVTVIGITTAFTALVGRRAYVEGDGAATVTEALVADGEPEETGLQVVQSTVDPLGNGLSVKTDVIADDWTELKGSERVEALDVTIPWTQEYVAPPADPASDPNTIYQPINKDRSLKRTIVIPTEVFTSFYRAFEFRGSLPPVPPVLKSLVATWNIGNGTGSSNTTGWGTRTSRGSYSVSDGGNANSSRSIRPNVTPVIEQVWTNNLPMKMHFFYLEDPTEANILTYLGVKMSTTVNAWPVFKPKSVSVSLFGQSGNVQAQASVSVSKSSQSASASQSEGTGVSIQTMNDLLLVSPCLHATLTVTNGGSSTVFITSSASGSISGEVNAFANSSQSVAVSGATDAEGLSATTPADIPRSGIYLVDIKTEFFRQGYARVAAATINASVLA